MSDLLAEICLSSFLHFAQHHSRDLLGRKDLFSLTSVDLDVRLTVLLDNGEREEFNIMLHGRVRPFATDESLRIEHGVLGIRRQLVLSGIANQSLAVSGERHVGWCNSITLIISYNFHATILVDADTSKQDMKR